MKICHIFPSVLLHDGPSNVLKALIDELAEQGIENVVVGLKSAPEERNPRALIERTRSKYVELAMGMSMMDASVLPKLIRTLRQERPDIVLCNLVRANLYGTLAARIAGRAPVITVAHNVERYMLMGGVVNCATRFAERRLSALAALHVGVSGTVGRALKERLGVDAAKVRVIANGLGPAQFPLTRMAARDALGIPPDVIVIGSVGRLHKQKN